MPEHINGTWHRTTHHGGLTWNISFNAASDDPATYNYSACPDELDDGPRQGFAPFSGLNISGTSPDGIAFNGSVHEEDFESTTDDT